MMLVVSIFHLMILGDPSDLYVSVYFTHLLVKLHIRHRVYVRNPCRDIVDIATLQEYIASDLRVILIHYDNPGTCLPKYYGCHKDGRPNYLSHRYRNYADTMRLLTNLRCQNDADHAVYLNNMWPTNAHIRYYGNNNCISLVDET